MAHQEMQQLQQHLQKAEEQIAEIEYTQQSLQELAEVASDTEIRVPVANGVFVKAKIQEPQKLLVNVGSDTCLEKPTEQVREMLMQQVMQIAEIHEQMSHKMQDLMETLKKKEAELNKLTGE